MQPLSVAPTNNEGTNNMTLIASYKSKKEMKASIGQPLLYIETSIFGPEYISNGTITVANRPHITGTGREWFGRVTMENDKIVGVS